MVLLSSYNARKNYSLNALGTRSQSGEMQHREVEVSTPPFGASGAVFVEQQLQEEDVPPPPLPPVIMDEPCASVVDDRCGASCCTVVVWSCVLFMCSLVYCSTPDSALWEWLVSNSLLPMALWGCFLMAGWVSLLCFVWLLNFTISIFSRLTKKKELNNSRRQKDAPKGGGRLHRDYPFLPSPRVGVMFLVSLLCLLAILLTPTLIQVYPLYNVVSFQSPTRPASCAKHSPGDTHQIHFNNLQGEDSSASSESTTTYTYPIISSIRASAVAVLQPVWPGFHNLVQSISSSLRRQGEERVDDENGWLRQDHGGTPDLTPSPHNIYLPQTCCVHHPDHVHLVQESPSLVPLWLVLRWGRWCESWEGRMDQALQDDSKSTVFDAILGGHLTRTLAVYREHADVWMFQVLCHQQRAHAHPVASSDGSSAVGCQRQVLSTPVGSYQSPLLSLHQLFHSVAPASFACPHNSWLMSALPDSRPLVNSLHRVTAVLHTTTFPGSSQTVAETLKTWDACFQTNIGSLARIVEEGFADLRTLMWHATGASRQWNVAKETVQSCTAPLILRVNEYSEYAFDAAMDLGMQFSDCVDSWKQCADDDIKLWPVEDVAVHQSPDVPVRLLKRLHGMCSYRDLHPCPAIFGPTVCNRLSGGTSLIVAFVASAYGGLRFKLHQIYGAPAELLLKYPVIRPILGPVSSFAVSAADHIQAAGAALSAKRTFTVISSENSEAGQVDSESAYAINSIPDCDLQVERMWIEWWSIGCIYGMALGSVFISVVLFVRFVYRYLYRWKTCSPEGRQASNDANVYGERRRGAGCSGLLVVALEIVVSFLGCVMWSRGGDGFGEANAREEMTRGLPSGSAAYETIKTIGQMKGNCVRYLVSFMFQIRNDGLLLLCNAISSIANLSKGGSTCFQEAECGGAGGWTSAGDTDIVWWFYQSTTSFFSHLAAFPPTRRIVEYIYRLLNNKRVLFPLSNMSKQEVGEQPPSRIGDTDPALHSSLAESDIELEHPVMLGAWVGMVVAFVMWRLWVPLRKTKGLAVVGAKQLQLETPTDNGDRAVSVEVLQPVQGKEQNTEVWNKDGETATEGHRGGRTPGADEVHREEVLKSSSERERTPKGNIASADETPIKPNLFPRQHEPFLSVTPSFAPCAKSIPNSSPAVPLSPSDPTELVSPVPMLALAPQGPSTDLQPSDGSTLSKDCVNRSVYPIVNDTKMVVGEQRLPAPSDAATGGSAPVVASDWATCTAIASLTAAPVVAEDADLAEDIRHGSCSILADSHDDISCESDYRQQHSSSLSAALYSPAPHNIPFNPLFSVLSASVPASSHLSPRSPLSPPGACLAMDMPVSPVPCPWSEAVPPYTAPQTPASSRDQPDIALPRSHSYEPVLTMDPLASVNTPDATGPQTPPASSLPSCKSALIPPPLDLAYISSAESSGFDQDGEATPSFPQSTPAMSTPATHTPPLSSTTTTPPLVTSTPISPRATAQQDCDVLNKPPNTPGTTSEAHGAKELLCQFTKTSEACSQALCATEAATWCCEMVCSSPVLEILLSHSGLIVSFLETLQNFEPPTGQLLNEPVQISIASVFEQLCMLDSSASLLHVIVGTLPEPSGDIGSDGRSHHFSSPVLQKALASCTWKRRSTTSIDEQYRLEKRRDEPTRSDIHDYIKNLALPNSYVLKHWAVDIEKLSVDVTNLHEDKTRELALQLAPLVDHAHSHCSFDDDLASLLSATVDYAKSHQELVSFHDLIEGLERFREQCFNVGSLFIQTSRNPVDDMRTAISRLQSFLKTILETINFVLENSEQVAESCISFASNVPDMDSSTSTPVRRLSTLPPTAPELLLDQSLSFPEVTNSYMPPDSSCPPDQEVSVGESIEEPIHESEASGITRSCISPRGVITTPLVTVPPQDIPIPSTPKQQVDEMRVLDDVTDIPLVSISSEVQSSPVALPTAPFGSLFAVWTTPTTLSFEKDDNADQKSAHTEETPLLSTVIPAEPLEQALESVAPAASAPSRASDQKRRSVASGSSRIPALTGRHNPPAALPPTVNTSSSRKSVNSGAAHAVRNRVRHSSLSDMASSRNQGRKSGKSGSGDRCKTQTEKKTRRGATVNSLDVPKNRSLDKQATKEEDQSRSGPATRSQSPSVPLNAPAIAHDVVREAKTGTEGRSEKDRFVGGGTARAAAASLRRTSGTAIAKGTEPLDRSSLADVKRCGSANRAGTATSTPRASTPRVPLSARSQRGCKAPTTCIPLRSLKSSSRYEEVHGCTTFQTVSSGIGTEGADGMRGGGGRTMKDSGRLIVIRSQPTGRLDREERRDRDYSETHANCINELREKTVTRAGSRSISPTAPRQPAIAVRSNSVQQTDEAVTNGRGCIAGTDCKTGKHRCSPPSGRTCDKLHDSHVTERVVVKETEVITDSQSKDELAGPPQVERSAPMKTDDGSQFDITSHRTFSFGRSAPMCQDRAPASNRRAETRQHHRFASPPPIRQRRTPPMTAPPANTQTPPYSPGPSVASSRSCSGGAPGPRRGGGGGVIVQTPRYLPSTPEVPPSPVDGGHDNLNRLTTFLQHLPAQRVAAQSGGAHVLTPQQLPHQRRQLFSPSLGLLSHMAGRSPQQYDAVNESGQPDQACPNRNAMGTEHVATRAVFSTAPPSSVSPDIRDRFGVTLSPPIPFKMSHSPTSGSPSSPLVTLSASTQAAANLSHSCNMSSTSFPCSPRITSIPSLRLPTHAINPSPPHLPAYRHDGHPMPVGHLPPQRSLQPSGPLPYSCYNSGSLTARNFHAAHACYANISPATSPMLQCSFATNQQSLSYRPLTTRPLLCGTVASSPASRPPYSLPNVHSHLNVLVREGTSLRRMERPVQYLHEGHATKDEQQRRSSPRGAVLQGVQRD
eukprot:GHVS01004659.1.p1 GENE.GHVS01004659.1~~GHVS01004659.1.p1  ORF type:complete len:2869 (+),score=249.75 GHVS01004659.1:126-8732(+)